MTQLTTTSSREQELQSRLTNLCAQAERCVVTTDEEAEKATSLASAIKANERALEEDRKSLTGPLNSVVKEINARYKRMASAIPPALAKLTGRDGCLTEWNVAKQRKAEEAARKAREELEAQRLEEARLAEEEEARLAEAGDKEAAALAKEQATEALDQAVEQPAKVNTPSSITRGTLGGSASVSSVGKWRVTDLEALVFFNLKRVRSGKGMVGLEINEKALGQQARMAGEKPEIPGVEFYRENVTVVR